MVCVAACTQQEVLSGEQNDSGLDSPVLGGVGGCWCGTGGGTHRAAHVPPPHTQCCNSVHACCVAEGADQVVMHRACWSGVLAPPLPTSKDLAAPWRCSRGGSSMLD